MTPRDRLGRGWPITATGQRIGLLGGSFNPPHAGHLAASLLAMQRLRLDAVWWLVTPGNPLKSAQGLPATAQRIIAARALAQHPRIVVTDVETALKTRFTVETLQRLRARYPGVAFVWLMGADNLAQFHRWRQWRTLARLAPIAVIDRPTASLTALGAPAALALARYRVSEARCGNLARHHPPAWSFLHGLKSPLSSTALRARNR